MGLKKYLKNKFISRLNKYSNQPYITIKELESIGIKIEFNPYNISSNITIPTEWLKEIEIEISSRKESTYAKEYEPLLFYTYFNYNLNSNYQNEVLNVQLLSDAVTHVKDFNLFYRIRGDTINEGSDVTRIRNYTLDKKSDGKYIHQLGWHNRISKYNYSLKESDYFGYSKVYNPYLNRFNTNRFIDLIVNINKKATVKILLNNNLLFDKSLIAAPYKFKNIELLQFNNKLEVYIDENPEPYITKNIKFNHNVLKKEETQINYGLLFPKEKSAYLHKNMAFFIETKNVIDDEKDLQTYANFTNEFNEFSIGSNFSFLSFNSNANIIYGEKESDGYGFIINAFRNYKRNYKDLFGIALEKNKINLSSFNSENNQTLALFFKQVLNTKKIKINIGNELGLRFKNKSFGYSTSFKINHKLENNIYHQLDFNIHSFFSDSTFNYNWRYKINKFLNNGLNSSIFIENEKKTGITKELFIGFNLSYNFDNTNYRMNQERNRNTSSMYQKHSENYSTLQTVQNSKTKTSSSHQIRYYDGFKDTTFKINNRKNKLEFDLNERNKNGKYNLRHTTESTNFLANGSLIITTEDFYLSQSVVNGFVVLKNEDPEFDGSFIFNKRLILDSKSVVLPRLSSKSLTKIKLKETKSNELILNTKNQINLIPNTFDSFSIVYYRKEYTRIIKFPNLPVIENNFCIITNNSKKEEEEKRIKLDQFNRVFINDFIEGQYTITFSKSSMTYKLIINKNDALFKRVNIN